MRAEGSFGIELYSLNTQESLSIVSDINGAGSSNPQHLTELNGELLFFASNTGSNCDLWRSDGTKNGTTIVGPLSLSGNCIIDNVTKLNNQLIAFKAFSPGTFFEPYFANLNNIMIVPINPVLNSSAGSNDFTYFNGDIFFEADDGTNDDQLWKVELGTFDTTMITNNLFFSVDHLTSFNGKMYFADSRELWESDGTTVGTHTYVDLNQGIREIVAVNSDMYIAADELWISNGTAPGTGQLVDINNNGRSYPKGLVAIEDTVYFTAEDGLTGIELWKNENTAISTQVADINAKTGSKTRIDAAVYKEELYFPKSFGDSILMKTDGTPEGTVSAIELFRHYNLIPIAEWNGALYFISEKVSSSSTQSDVYLWKSDGTKEGTDTLLHLGEVSMYDEVLARQLDHPTEFYISVDMMSGMKVLIRTDGTKAGTVIVQIDETEDHIFYNGDFYHSMDDGINEGELFKNGVLLKDINSIGQSEPSDYFIYNDILYFSADGGVTGREVWQTDGTVAGTVLLKDINTDINGSSNPDHFTLFNEELYFVTGSSHIPYKIYKTDGTTAGTIELTGTTVLNQPFQVFQTHLYFGGLGLEGYELWRSDGTPSGTALFKDINPDDSSNPSHFYTFNNRLYFTAESPILGDELWTSDGTALGTHIVADINPGPANSTATTDYFAFGDHLAFLADDGAVGREIFVLEGCPSSINEVCPIGTCDISTTSYRASGEIEFSGFHRLLSANTLSLNGGGGSILGSEFEIQNGGILSVLTIGCN